MGIILDMPAKHASRSTARLVIAPHGMEPVSHEAFEDIVQRIVTSIEPEQIVLLGSYAYRTPTPDSDVDLLVVLGTPASRADRQWAVSRLLLPRRRGPLVSPLGDAAPASTRLGWRFHAQQCAEKYLKAALIDRGAVLPRTHDLLLLSGLLAQVGVVLRIDPARLSFLSDQAMLTRYPGGEITPDEARAVLMTSRVVCRQI